MDEHRKELALALFIVAVGIVAAVSLAVALAGTASAYEVYTNNELSTTAKWLIDATCPAGAAPAEFRRATARSPSPAGRGPE